jgi:hypothetical protein
LVGLEETPLLADTARAYERYLSFAPNARDADAVRMRLEALR